MFVPIDKGSITSVKGIKAAGIHAGLKRKRKDLALIVSDTPASVSGTFTLNKVQAAPLQISKKIINRGNKIRAILINSGNANACTGETGYKDALEMQKLCAQKLNMDTNEVIISSTGVIGEYLPMDILKNGIETIVNKVSPDGGVDAAKAIMTTDTKAKHCAYKIRLKEGEVTLGGIAKGSGMIMPNMATMLAFIATDAEIGNKVLRKMLLDSVGNSFNKISVDGDTSTNDMVVMMANGVSGVKITEGSENEKIFSEALQQMTVQMAKEIVKDGEGATKLIELNVIGGKSEDDVNKIAETIANSPLFKTAIYGSDPNWGRIIAAVGRSGVNINPAKIEIMFDDVVILGRDYTHDFDEEEATAVLSKKEISITVNLNEGKASTTWWTCDFTEKYIEINASYRT